MSTGHSVTALVRNESSLSDTKEGLTIVKGSPLDVADVERAFTVVPGIKPSCVIVALSSSRTSDNPFSQQASPHDFMLECHQNLFESMKTHGVPKIVTVGAQGVGDSLQSLPWLMRIVIATSNMSYAYKDHNLVDSAIKSSGLAFVIARPTRLTDEAARPVKFYGNDGTGIGSFAGISRSSVANFAVEAVSKSDWDGQTPVMSN